jgi:hypothetical protein
MVQRAIISVDGPSKGARAGNRDDVVWRYLETFDEDGPRSQRRPHFGEDNRVR